MIIKNTVCVRESKTGHPKTEGSKPEVFRGFRSVLVRTQDKMKNLQNEESQVARTEAGPGSLCMCVCLCTSICVGWCTHVPMCAQRGQSTSNLRSQSSSTFHNFFETKSLVGLESLAAILSKLGF